MSINNSSSKSESEETGVHPFPLMHLPILVQQKIVQTADPFSIVNFARTSKRAANIVKCTNLYVESLAVKVKDEVHRIELKLFYRKNKYTWCYKPFKTTVVPERKNQKVHVNKFALESAKWMSNFISVIVRYPISTLSFSGVFRGNKVFFESGSYHQIDKIILHKSVEFPEEAKIVKDLEYLHVSECNWFSVFDAAKFNPVYLKLRKSNVDEIWLNTAIKQWTNSSGMKKLKKLTIQNVSFNLLIVLNGITTQQFDENRRQRIYPGKREIDCQNAHDIERKEDGLLASIVFGVNMVDFVVWHSRFPGSKAEKH